MFSQVERKWKWRKIGDCNSFISPIIKAKDYSLFVLSPLSFSVSSPSFYNQSTNIKLITKDYIFLIFSLASTNKPVDNRPHRCWFLRRWIRMSNQVNSTKVSTPHWRSWKAGIDRYNVNYITFFLYFIIRYFTVALLCSCFFS